jgi:hypothetical protein
MPWTPYADLDDLLEGLLGHWRRILADSLASYARRTRGGSCASTGSR